MNTLDTLTSAQNGHTAPSPLFYLLCCVRIKRDPVSMAQHASLDERSRKMALGKRDKQAI